LNELMPFEYIFSNKGQYAVVVMAGHIDKPNKLQLEEILNQVIESPAQYVVIDFRRVTGVDNRIIPTLIQVQHEIRQLKTLRLSGMRINIKVDLSKQGAIRGDEISKNMNEAFQYFVALNKRRI
jgi:anti-anti-sigma regulatory factor